MSNSLERRATELVNTQADGVGSMIDTFNRTQLSAVEKFSRVFASLLAWHVLGRRRAGPSIPAAWYCRS